MSAGTTVLGSDIQIQVAPNAGSATNWTPGAYVDIANVTSFTFSKQRDKKLTSVLRKKYKYTTFGPNAITYTMAALLTAGDAGQAILRDADAQEVVVYLRVLYTETDGFSVPCLVGSHSGTATPDGSIDITYDFAALDDETPITAPPPPSDAQPTTVIVAPASATIEPTRTAQLTAQVKDQYGNVMSGQTVTWQSSNGAVATVGSTGLVAGVALGTATITATCGQAQGAAAITVAYIVGSVTLDQTALALQPGDTDILTATILSTLGTVIPGAVPAWTSSAPPVATVDPDGTVTAVAEGASTITASYGGKSATCAVTVSQLVATVTVSPSTVSLTSAGQTAQLTATVRDGNGNVMSGQTVMWTSDNPLIASVDQTGLARAVATGSTTIRADAGGAEGTAAVTVTLPAPPPGALDISLGHTAYDVGETTGEIDWLYGSPTYRYRFQMSGNLNDILTRNPNSPWAARYGLMWQCFSDTPDQPTAPWGGDWRQACEEWAIANGRTLENVFGHAASGVEHALAPITSIDLGGVVALGMDSQGHPYNSVPYAPGHAIEISGAVQSGTEVAIATISTAGLVTTSTPHGRGVGDPVSVYHDRVPGNAAVGEWIVQSVPSATTFTVNGTFASTITGGGLLHVGLSSDINGTHSVNAQPSTTSVTLDAAPTAAAVGGKACFVGDGTIALANRHISWSWNDWRYTLNPFSQEGWDWAVYHHGKVLDPGDGSAVANMVFYDQFAHVQFIAGAIEWPDVATYIAKIVDLLTHFRTVAYQGTLTMVNTATYYGTQDAQLIEAGGAWHGENAFHIGDYNPEDWVAWAEARMAAGCVCEVTANPGYHGCALGKVNEHGASGAPFSNAGGHHQADGNDRIIMLMLATMYAVLDSDTHQPPLLLVDPGQSGYWGGKTYKYDAATNTLGTGVDTVAAIENFWSPCWEYDMGLPLAARENVTGILAADGQTAPIRRRWYTHDGVTADTMVLYHRARGGSSPAYDATTVATVPLPTPPSGKAWYQLGVDGALSGTAEGTNIDLWAGEAVILRLAAAPVALGFDYYVSALAGGGGDGSAGNPWTIDEARVQPGLSGKLVAMRGDGLYDAGEGGYYEFTTQGVLAGGYDDPTGKVIFMAYPGERPRIRGTGELPIGSLGIVRGVCPFTWFVGLDVAPRRATTNGAGTGPPTQSDYSGTNCMGFDCEGDGVKYIFPLPHDNYGNGIGMYRTATNAELYGGYIYGNGMTGSEPGISNGHGVYQQSDSNHWVRESLIWWQFGFGYHGYSGEQSLETVEGNILINNRVMRGWEFLIGSATGHDTVVRFNRIFRTAAALAQQGVVLEIGWDLSGAGDPYLSNITFTDNRVRGGVEFGAITPNFTNRRNVLSGYNGPLIQYWWNNSTDLPAGYDVDDNDYFMPSAGTFLTSQLLSGKTGSPPWGGSYATLSAFQTASGLDGTSRFTIGQPADFVEVRPVTKYDAIFPATAPRPVAHVYFENYSGAASITVDLTGVLSVGDDYTIYHALAYVRDLDDPLRIPAAAGTFDGGMMQLATDAPAGRALLGAALWGGASPQPFGREAGAFVVEKNGSVSAAPILALAPSTIGFAATVGQGNPAAQTVNVTNIGTGTLSGLSVAVSYAGGEPTGWLSASLDQSAAPAVLTLNAALGSLTAGTYHATARITASGATNSPQDVTVTFTVSAASASPHIVKDQIALSFDSVQGDTTPPVSQYIHVTNGGGGTLHVSEVRIPFAAGSPDPVFKAYIGGVEATAANGPWTAPLDVEIRPFISGFTDEPPAGDLLAGDYGRTCYIYSGDADNSPQTVGATLHVAAPPAPHLVANPTQLNFAALENGAPPAQQAVFITDSADSGWIGGITPQIIYAGGEPTGWLQYTSYSAIGGSHFNFDVISTALAPATYHATLRFDLAGADNTPLDVPVLYAVSSPASLGLPGTTQLEAADLGGWVGLSGGVYVLMAWVRFDTLTGYQTPLYVGDGSEEVDCVELAPTGIFTLLEKHTGGTYDIQEPGTHPIAEGTWHHLALVRDGDALRVYLDGVLEASGTGTASSRPAPAETFIEIGGWSSSERVTGAAYAGKLWVGGTALTGAQIGAEKAHVQPVVTANALSAWKLTGATDLADYLGAGHDLVDVGGTATTESDVPSGVSDP